MKEEICNIEDCKEAAPLYPSKECYKNTGMSDAAIGRTTRGIADQGFNAIVKKGKNGIVILKEKCEIVASDKKL